MSYYKIFIIKIVFLLICTFYSLLGEIFPELFYDIVLEYLVSFMFFGSFVLDFYYSLKLENKKE